MQADNKQLKLFTTRMRQLILEYKEKKQEIADLYQEVEDCEKQIGDLKAQLAKSQQEYDTLRMAKMLSASTEDVTEAKHKIQNIISDIDRCLTLLNNSQK